ncbi:J domain-containing protein [Flavobacterium sp. ANB]|uniref:DnaJ C-terminal domain-containing protein n=1 Tax=unclassified Flavobacterium TaxID=196869 RepID=UPI0012B97CD1|nr:MULTISPECIES: J domain-containing protein [unclassified Flavobacterium]MBF4516408.1 J domain-containing protein [Flavobacterium sp. ANB]MTD69695.1 DnaJ domain-containing protein [Flavobacterium sp. LC2016-13]
MDYIDYYKTLDITKSATEAEIKKAYRKAARKYHPDLNPNDKEAEKKFKEINEANEVLSNPENRKKYDKYGKDWKHADEFEKAGYDPNQRRSRQQSSQDFSGGDFSGFSGSDFGGNDFSDFFNSMYGGARSGRTQSKYRGQDFNAELELDLASAYTIHKQNLAVNGKNIRITIPAGVENGQVIKISGHGGPGANGGPNGDLYLTFLISNNSDFKREGNNLYADVDLDLYTAILGGEIYVNTFDGKVKIKVPEETQTGTKVKLKGKGFPVYKKENQFGDLYITYNIKTPTKLSQKEKELFQELSKIRNHE